MAQYRVQGTYLMTYYVSIDRTVEAESEEDAIQSVIDDTSAGAAYDSDTTWADSGPTIRYLTEPDECAMCGCGSLGLMAVSVGSDDNWKAWVCDSCGHAHLRDPDVTDDVSE